MGVIDDIKARIDIVDLVKEYVPNLKPAGTNFRGLCPFHSEKTPSFMVSADKQIFKCFGCSEGGSVFDFFMKSEGVEFPEALRALAARAGIELTRRDPAQENRITRLMDLCAHAAACFAANLTQHTAQSVRDYVIMKRGLNEQSMKDFQIGFSLDGWTSLTDALRKKGFTQEELIASGLVIEKEGRVYDRFRRRIMFPIRDGHGNVVGFTGRLLPEDEKTAQAGKYVNTPSTVLYDKSRVLYGFDRAKTHIRKNGMALLAEGQMDVIALHQLGFPYAVATSGTALTGEQVQFLKRHASTLVLGFDSDHAGQEAIRRGSDAALAEGLEVKVLLLPEGVKDPGDCLLKSDGAGMIAHALQHAQPLMEYFFQKALRDHTVTTIEGKKAIAKEVLGAIMKLQNRVEADLYLTRLSGTLGVSDRVLREALPSRGSARAAGTTPSGVAPGATPSRTTVSNLSVMAERVLVVAAHTPSLLPSLIDQLGPEHIPSQGNLQEWYTRMIVLYTTLKEPSLVYSALLKEPWYADLTLRYSHVYTDDMDEVTARRELNTLIKRIKREALTQQLTELEQKLLAHEHVASGGTPDDTAKLMKEFRFLSDQLQALMV